MNYRQNFITYLIVSLCCTGMVVYLSTWVCDTYYKKYAYTFDQVNGLIDNSQAYKDVKEQGKLAAAYHQYMQNHRSPYVPMVLSIVAPSLLRSHSGHLLVTIPFFLLFLLLWAYLMELREYPMWSIITLLFAFSTTWIIYGQYAGIAFNLPDTIASYPLAMCGLLLLIWRENRKLAWLILFSVSLSSAVLTRYIFSVYAFILFAPILAWLFYEAIKTKALTARQIVISVISVGVIVAVICGYFVINNYNYTFGYYNTWLDNENQTMSFNRWFSFKTFMLTFPPFFGRLHLITFSLLILLQFFSWKKLPPREKMVNGAISLWLLIGLPFLWVVVLGSNGLKVRSAFLAAMPLTWIAISSLSPLRNSQRTIRYTIITIVALISVTHLWRSYHILNSYLGEVDPKAASTKTATLSIADNLMSRNKKQYSIVDLTGLYLAESVAVEYFYKTGSTAKLCTGEIFSPHGDLWRSELYKNLTPAEIGRTVLQQVKRESNVVLIKNPDSISIPSKYSRQIARFVEENLSKDRAWHEFNTSLNNETLRVMIKE